MSTQDIGWHFPPTGGGEAAGWNHSGIAHFRGRPLDSLARETIQNSLDARARLGEPVHVSFELRELTQAQFAGYAELTSAMEACLGAVDDDPRAEAALRSALKVLGEDAVTFLHISDRRTTGLLGDRWEKLVKKPGTSYKPGVVGPGGSQGIGKYSPFAVSPLRTIFYWSRYEVNGAPVEVFQGKTILTVHRRDGREVHGTGFFGVREDCMELRGEDIPSRIRQIEDGFGSGSGTSLWVAGFPAWSDWRQRVGRSVVANYFPAIQQGQLTVTVEPDDSSTEDEWMLEINADTLDQWFAYLADDQAVSAEEFEELSEARVFSNLMRREAPTVVMDPPDVDLGAPQLWIDAAKEAVDEALPNKVALIRGTGMLITAEQKRIGNFRNLRDYAAVCLFDASDGEANEFLKGMEGPQHNQFEPDRLDDPEHGYSPERGHKALERLRTWIRSQLGEYAAVPRVEVSEEITELAHLLPLDDPGPFKQPPSAENGEDPGEKAFGEMGMVRVKPIKARVQPLQLDDDDDDDSNTDGGDGTDAGNEGGASQGGGGGGEGGGGAGDGDASGGTGSRGGGRGTTPIEIRAVRVLPIEGYENRCRVSFTPSITGSVQLHIEEAGDSTALKRPDLRAFVNGDEQQLDSFDVTAEERVTLEIHGNESLQNRAWRVVALKEPRK